MKCVTFNVLADTYIGYGDYGHVDPELLRPGLSTEAIVQKGNGLDADIVRLQEVEKTLLGGKRRLVMILKQKLQM